MKSVVVGAGPVGALTALYAARRGYEVDVFDLRGDLRDASTTPLNFSRSINLALSERGINAIRHADSPGLLEAILNDTIPMHGRMIHGVDSSGGLTESSQLYDVHGRFLRAVDRGNLNKILLDAIADLPNVRLHFYHKLTGVDFRKRKAWFEQRTATNQRIDEIEVDFDLLLGCDGAHSRVRYHLNKFTRLSYSQSYIDTLWCEFTIPPAAETLGRTASAADGFATSPHHLHIWPSRDMMFIAIPSIDRTFTCTLFAPSATFAHLEAEPHSIELFFETHFPGATSLIGPASLAKQFSSNPHLPLISVKCTPHHFSSTGVILGDAAHAMVPFYGQGMNAGLEDVRVLFSFLDDAENIASRPIDTSNPPNPSSSSLSTTLIQPTITNPTAFTTTMNNASTINNTTTASSSSSSSTTTTFPQKHQHEQRARALEAYTTHRVPDAHTINDLALQNYHEMHAGVQSRTYLARKHIEEWLADRFPGTGFATQYARVSFSNQRYSEVLRSVEKQSRVLGTLAAGFVGGVGLPFVVGLGWVGMRWWRGRDAGVGDVVRSLLGRVREEFGRGVGFAAGLVGRR